MLMEAYEGQLRELDGLEYPYDREYEAEIKRIVKKKIGKLQMVMKRWWQLIAMMW